MKTKIMTAMSGGVDSSVAAALLLSAGYDCSGAIMRLFVPNGKESANGEADAAAVAAKMGIPFSVYDMQNEFRENVINPFIASYEAGETPNPCVVCNKTMKFGAFLERAQLEGCTKIATGHYANVENNSGRYTISRAADLSKDQSYVLWSLSQKVLSSLVLPLGGLTKKEVREIAAKHCFANAENKESQDICFVPDGRYSAFIENETGRSFPDGDFVDTDGNVLGRHKGLIRYTVGQRRGLGLSLKAPLYVKEKDAASNRIILCPDEGLYKKSLDAKSANWMACEAPSAPLRIEAAVRYGHRTTPATVFATGENTFHVEFDCPVRAISKGQSVVLYDGRTVVGGGVIV